MNETTKTVTVSVGPFRIPLEHKNGLLRLKADRPHITMSSLIREAIYLLLIKRGIIEVEEEYGDD